MSVAWVAIAALCGGVVGASMRAVVARFVGITISSATGVHVVVCAGVGAVTAWALGPIPLAVAWVAVMLVAAVASIVDVEVKRLPDQLVIVATVLAAVLLVWPAMETGSVGRWALAIGIGVASGCVYFLFALVNPAGIGMGDVKFAIPLGIVMGYLGWPVAVAGILLAFVFNGVGTLVALATGRVKRGGSTAFGPYMTASAVLTVVALRVFVWS
jgi:leader peptidase (prepilin peptidase)/N-methyltransferase